MKKLEIPMEKLTTLFKWLYLFHILLAGNSVIYDTPIEKCTSLLVVALGAVVVLWRFLHIKDYINYPFLKLYILFAAAFALTLVVNWKYGWTSNFKILIWMTFQFAALYAFDLKKSKDDITKEFHVSLYIIIGFMTLANLVSIVMLFTNYLYYRILDESTTFLIGVAYWGRLYGVHTDPNYGAVLSVMAVMAALYMFLKTDKRLVKVLMGVSIAIQLMSMAFSASRTGMVTISVCMIVFFFIYSMCKGKKLVKSAVIAILAVVLVLGANKGIIYVYNGYTQIVAQMEIEKIENKDIDKDAENEKPKKELIKINREEELSGDVSNRRFDLWNNAAQIFKKKPILGIGFGNIVSYSQAELPDSYLLTNGFSIFNAFHNMIMDLLACQGIVGMIIFFSIMILSLIYLGKNMKNIPKEDWLKCTFTFSCCVGLVVSGVFVSHILYVNNQTTVVFWLLWGYLIYYVTKASRNNKKEEEK